MKWMVASDIHGSAKYCRELLDAYEREKADRLLLLGDLLYHGPRNDLPEEYAPKMVIAMLNAKKNQILCVRGNCDAEVDQMVLEFPILADYCMLDLGTKLVYATHGHLTSAEQLPPRPTGQEAPWRGRRMTRMSWAKYLPPNCAPRPSFSASILS